MPWTAVADDLTGAQDLASVLGRPAAPAWVSQDPQALRGPGPRVLDAATRFLPPGAAGMAVQGAWRQMGAVGRRYQKIDSTLRGNPREEVEAFLAAASAPWVLLQPSYPSLGRTVRQGVLWVHGQRLDRSEYARDPLSPARASGPQALLRGLPAAHAGSATLSRGQAALRAWIRAQRRKGARFLSFDCRHQGDLDLLARSALAEDCRHFAGASALAAALEAAQGRPRTLAPVPRLPWLILAGSLSAATFAQLLQLGRVPWIPLRCLYGRDWEIYGPGDIPSFAGHLRSYRALALSSLGARSQLGPWLRRVRAKGPWAKRRAADEALDSLASLGQGLLNRLQIGCLVTGGHTLERLFLMAGVQRTAVLGSALPGVALGKAYRRDGSWFWVASKPGGFGAADVLQRFLERAA